MDEDGYPEEDELKRIREWPEDWAALFAFIHSIWHWPDWGFTQEGNRVSLSTGGWSGNEEIIGALRDNALAWMVTWESSRRGGHYTFTIGPVD